MKGRQMKEGGRGGGGGREGKGEMAGEQSAGGGEGWREGGGAEKAKRKKDGVRKGEICRGGRKWSWPTGSRRGLSAVFHTE